MNIGGLLAANAGRDKAIALALRGRDAPFADGAFQDIIAANGALALGTRSIAYRDLLARNGIDALSANGDYDAVEEAKGRRRSSASRRCLQRFASTKIWASCA